MKVIEMKTFKNKSSIQVLWLSLHSFIKLLENMAWCCDTFELSDAWGDMVQASNVSVKTATIVCYDRRNDV